MLDRSETGRGGGRLIEAGRGGGSVRSEYWLGEMGVREGVFGVGMGYRFVDMGMGGVFGMDEGIDNDIFRRCSGSVGNVVVSGMRLRVV